MTTPNPAQIAGLLGCTEAQIRAQFAQNAKQLAAMADKAKTTGRKVNGYTAEELRSSADEAASKS